MKWDFWVNLIIDTGWMSLRTVCNYFRKFLDDVSLRNGGFITISAVDLIFIFWLQNWESQKVYWFVCVCVYWEGVLFERDCRKADFLFCQGFFCSLQVLIKKSPNWLNLKFPSSFLLLQSLFLNLLPLKWLLLIFTQWELFFRMRMEGSEREIYPVLPVE